LAEGTEAKWAPAASEPFATDDTPAQLRVARALLNWSREDLAAKSGIAAVTVKGFELRGTDPKLSTLNAWRRALEVAGVVFIDPNSMGGDDMGPGVRLRNAKKR
jgi:transcriptional regulator with XRE-family HTH domain